MRVIVPGHELPVGYRRALLGCRVRGILLSSRMPEISRFLGIVIRMYYQDHEPAHFHAVYGEYEITVRIADGLVEGRFPRRSLAHVLEWHALHAPELEENWSLARERKPLNQIAPLE